MHRRERPPIRQAVDPWHAAARRDDLLTARIGRLALNGAAARCRSRFILLPLVFVSWLAFFRQEIPSFPPAGLHAALVRRHLRQRAASSAASSRASRSGSPRPDRRSRSACRRASRLARRRFARPRGAVNTLLLLPLVVPGIVLGTAIYVFQIEVEIATGLPLLGSLGGLVAAPLLIIDPWTVRLVTASLAGFDRRSRRRRRTSAPTRCTTFRRVTLPRSGPASSPRRCSASSSRSAISRCRLFLVGAGPNDAADRDPAVSRMEDRSDHRGGLASCRSC